MLLFVYIAIFTDNASVYTCIIIIFLLFAEFRCLLEGQSPSIPPNEDDIMISGEVSAQPSPPPPGSCLITAQVEGTTLTRARYTRIASLMSSLLCLLTRALVYVGHTLHPLTLHWHCSAAERGDSNPRYSIGILSAMAQEGIIQINNEKLQDSAVPQRNVSVDVALYRVLVLGPFELYVGLGTSVSNVNTLQYSLRLHNYYHIYLNLAYIII